VTPTASVKLSQMKYDLCCYPEGCATPGFVPCQCNTRRILSKLENIHPQRKINVTSKSPVEDISVVTLIRTDTTLDHSQKAEKVCAVRREWLRRQHDCETGAFVAKGAPRPRSYRLSVVARDQPACEWRVMHKMQQVAIMVSGCRQRSVPVKTR
jgi:hypothetical protein